MRAETPIGRRLAEIDQRIRDACRRSDRDPAGVTLVGVSKLQPLEQMQAAAAAGLRVFGESRVQEAQQKIPEMPLGLEWHLIGPLQSNKVKTAARLFDVFHALDREKIIRLLDQEAGEQGRKLRGFLQVHLGEEESKHGFPAEGFADAVAGLAQLEHLEILGLMAIPPYEQDLELARGWFRRLRELREELSVRPEWRGWRGALSMGMSHDFETAIEEGATHVRVGTALFGERP
ncbi:MAG: YggS family pyridoxal phosphate-dependent enzyme [Thermoanaerobaculia bacterium]|nr:YggS family pyridoxal phosphate-dependent enzyme [Thermoanaerobaculia bacterium]